MTAVVVVSPDGWLAALDRARGDGLVVLDLLTGVDRGDEVEVVVRLVEPTAARSLLLATRVPAADAVLPTATALFAAADWHERETAEMFGIRFDGHPDPRPLLRRTALGRPPLRKDVVLAARVATPWPGGAGADESKAGSRRRQAPPGVPDGWLDREGP